MDQAFLLPAAGRIVCQPSSASAHVTIQKPVRSASRLLIVAFGFVLLFAACAPRQAQNARLFNEWNAKCKEAADLLETVKDVPAAEAAAPKLIAVMKELLAIDEKLQASYDPEDVDAGDSPRMTKRAAEGIREMQRLMLESVRIGQNPEMRAALGEAWHLLPAAAMMEAGVEFPPVETPSP